MTQLSPHASALLMCLSGPPQRAYDLRTQIGWPEDRFARALSQLVNSYPPMIEIFGNVDDHDFCPPVTSKRRGTTAMSTARFTLLFAVLAAYAKKMRPCGRLTIRQRTCVVEQGPS